MRRKGFTLVELLVVIAIIALLMGILMPALSRVRQLAFRLTCGTNLSGIGKAMLIYANDYEDELPRAGGRETVWGGPVVWDAPSRFQAYTVDAQGKGGKATISSCFYLLVKYAEVTPKSFICKGDAGTNVFKIQDVVPAGSTLELIDLWDFGPDAGQCCSYSYHMPFGQYALTTSGEPGLAVAADRNPFLKSPAAEGVPLSEFMPDATGYTGTAEKARKGNAITHQNDGQQVLFLDSHVEFAKRPWCSLEDDNIYLVSRDLTKGSIIGDVPTLALGPKNRKDSVLVHGGEKKGRLCFAAETPVWIDGRLIPIAQAAVGQVAGGFPANRMAVSGPAWRIDRVDAHEGVFADVHVLVLENGESLCVVGSHIFLLADGTWVRVEDLTAGSVLQAHDGPIRVVAAMRPSRPYIGTVYNLKIEGADRYFVGRAGVVARDY